VWEQVVGASCWSNIPDSSNIPSQQRSDIVWELLVAAINKPVALVKTVRKDLATAQKELEVTKT
jgi:hypothetical protein